MLGASNSSNKSTPHSLKQGSYNHISTGDSAKTELDDAAKKEANRLAEERIRIDSITLELAQPDHPDAKAAAAESTEKIAKALESLLLLEEGAKAPRLSPGFNGPSLKGKLKSLAT
ncbi:hypothetical protein GGI21_005501, partial [Coemansia aciculifera]